MSLYEISEQYRDAVAFFDEADDMPEEAIADTLEAIAGEFEDKALAVAAYIKNLEADVDSIKVAEKEMAQRRKYKENKAAKLRDYLLGCMSSVDKKKIPSPHFDLAIKKNPPRLVITDEDQIPDKYKKEVVTTKVDNAALKKDVKEGAEYDFCHLEQTNRLDIK